MIEVWHKDSMAGNLLIGVSNMLLASVLSANKVQVLSQVRVKFKLLIENRFVLRQGMIH